MLDIAELRLTEEEIPQVAFPREVAQAQLVKALDGIRLWLYSEIDGGGGIAKVQMELEDAMKQAGM